MATSTDESNPGPIALYVHIPFCETKCPYCDFNTYAGIEPLMPAYVAALRKEVEVWGGLLGHAEVRTIFFGGGTPSYLPAADIAAILDSVGEAFDASNAAEVTLEANPGDLSPPKLAAYLDSGVNRLSIGVQSLDDRLLGILGRRHTAEEARQAFRMAIDAGFDNVSIDLMYGLPHQTLDHWGRTVSAAAELGPHHVSMYCLTLEEGTPMAQWVGAGKMPDPDPDLAADMYLTAEDHLRNAGYGHYEISNWAQPGKESRHNLIYWRNQPFLGVGPGAHSYLAGRRFSNLKSPREYVRRLAPSLTLPLRGPEKSPFPHRGKVRMGVPVVETIEEIDRRMEMAETMMLGLRLEEGVSVEEFDQRFCTTPHEEFGEVMETLRTDGLIEAPDGHIRLTDRGRLLGNEAFSRFFQ